MKKWYTVYFRMVDLKNTLTLHNTLTYHADSPEEAAVEAREQEWDDGYAVVELTVYPADAATKYYFTGDYFVRVDPKVRPKQ